MKNVIMDLFYDYQQTEEYAEEMKRFEKDNSAVQNGYDFFVRPLYNNKDSGAYEAEDAYVSAMTATENFAFEQGYRYAMKLVLSGAGKEL